MKASKPLNQFFFQLTVLNRKSRLALINFAFFPFVIKLKNKIVNPFLYIILLQLIFKGKEKMEKKRNTIFSKKKKVILIFQSRLPGYFSCYANQKLYQIIKDEEVNRVALKTKDTCLEISRLLVK